MEGPDALKAQSKGQQIVSGEVHSFCESKWMHEFILEHELQLFKGRRMKRKFYVICRDRVGKGIMSPDPDGVHMNINEAGGQG